MHGDDLHHGVRSASVLSRLANARVNRHSKAARQRTDEAEERERPSCVVYARLYVRVYSCRCVLRCTYAEELRGWWRYPRLPEEGRISTESAVRSTRQALLSLQDHVVATRIWNAHLGYEERDWWVCKVNTSAPNDGEIIIYKYYLFY